MALDQPPADENQLRRSFEARLPEMLKRAKQVKLQAVIPAHWFSAAASECAGMYVSGYFYGAISVAQAYVEALAVYLADTHSVRRTKKPADLWHRLCREKMVTKRCADAALTILDDRNDFHHLNKDIETDFATLEQRAESAIEHIHKVESEIFACSPSDQAGVIELKNPSYWPSDTPGLAQIHLRSL